MDNPQFGKIQIIDPRTIWKNEERDFTPWLAENIEMLSDAIGFPIVIEETEKRVGKYELDMLGKVEGTNKVVVIENQLDVSDHKHLGQLLAYAAGLNASILIWITPEVNDEHRQAIEWLNDITKEDVYFFLVRPEVIQIENSKRAVQFHLEASPSEFIEDLKDISGGEEGGRHLFRRTFWAELFEYLSQNGHPWAKGRRTTNDSWISSSIGKSGIGANVSMAQGEKLRVEIYLGHQDEAQNKAWFAALEAHKAEIEKLLAPESVSWEPLDGRTASRIAVYLPYDKDRAISEAAYRVSLFPWISKNLTVMRDIPKKYLVA